MSRSSTEESPSPPAALRTIEPSLATAVSSTSENSADEKPKLRGYSLGEMIAGGGYATVYDYVATPACDRQLVAKVQDEGVEANKELYVLDRVKHKNVIELIGVEYVGDRIHLILPKMDATLMDAFRNVRLSPSQISYVIREVLHGLVALKRANFIYVDLKSGNVLMDSLGNIKLCDFGLAVEAPSSLLFGTIPWMPPEVFIDLAKKRPIERHPEYSFEFDVWMVGLLLFDARLSGALHKMKRHAPGIVASKLPQVGDFVQALRDDSIGYDVALRGLPDNALSFMRATIAPANRRRPVEQLLIHPFIGKLADSGRAGWMACAPVIVANVEIKRIKKKYDVNRKRDVAKAQRAQFEFEKPIFPDNDGGRDPLFGFDFPDDDGRAGAGRDPLFDFNELSDSSNESGRFRRRRRRREHVEDAVAENDVIIGVESEEDVVAENDVIIGVEPEEDAVAENDVIIGVEREEDAVEENDVIIGVESEEDVVAENDVIIGVEPEEDVVAENDVIIGVEPEEDAVAENDVIIGVEREEDAVEENDVIIGVESEEDVVAENDVIIGVESEEDVVAENDVIIGVEPEEDVVAENDVIIGVEPEEDAVAENDVIIGVESEEDVVAENDVIIGVEREEDAVEENDVITGLELDENAAEEQDVVTGVEPDAVTAKALDVEEFMVQTDAGYSCAFCEHTTTGRSRKQNMMKHVKSHLGIKDYVCRNGCGYKGSHFGHWKDHEARLCPLRR